MNTGHYPVSHHFAPTSTTKHISNSRGSRKKKERERERRWKKTDLEKKYKLSSCNTVTDKNSGYIIKLLIK